MSSEPLNQGDTINCGRSEDHGRDPDKDPAGRIALAGFFTIGSTILWFVSTSTNGVFNFFSDNPSFQLLPFLISICAGIWYLAFQLALRFKNIPWVFMVASLLCCFLFVLTVNAIDRKTAQYEAANEVVIEPGPILDPANPFESSFTIQNPSHTTSVSNVYYSCWWNDPEGPGKSTVLGFAYTNKIISLGPMVKADLKIHNFMGTPDRLSDATYFQIDVRYTRDGKERTSKFAFQIANTKGKFQWYRRGEGQDLQAFFKGLATNLPPPQHTWEVAPYIQVAVKSFKILPLKSDEDPSYELIYTFHNIGAFEARNIEWQWWICASNGSNLCGSGLTKPTNGIFPYGLWPGVTVTNREKFKGVDQATFGGVISNVCFLKGGILCESGGIKWLQYFVVTHGDKDVWLTQTYRITNSLGL